MQTDPHNPSQFNLHIHESNILQSFFDTSPVMMGIVDLEQSNIRHVIDNEATGRFFKRKVKDMSGKLSSELGFSKEIIRMWTSHYRIAEATLEPVTFEFYFLDKILSSTVNYLGKTDSGNSRFSYVLLDITELKASHSELEKKVQIRMHEIQQQKAQMEAVFELVSDGIIVFDMSGNVILVNKAQASISGFKRTEDLLSNFDLLRSNLELRDAEDKVLEKWPTPGITQGHTLEDLELKTRRLDTGEEKILSLSGGPIYNDNGEQILSVCITRDITRFKNAEFSETRYRYLFVNNPLPMLVYDKETSNFLDVNHSALRFYGYTRDEFLTLSLSDISAKKGSYHLKKNGETAAVEIHGHDMFFNNRKARLVLVNDVTQRERVENNLKDTVEKLETALKNVSDYKFALDQASILATTDANGVITYVNDKFCEISKYSREELIGKTHRVVNSGYHSKDFFKEFWDTITKGKVWRGEICNKAKDGTIYWVDTVIVPFLDVHGNPYQFVAVRNDITDRKTYQTALEEAINSRDEFLSIASHELKTPLTSLKLNTQMALRHKDQIERFPRYLDQTNKQIQRLAVLVDDMLDISRIATGRLSLQKVEIDLVELTQEVIDRVEDIIRQSGCYIETKLPEGCYGHWDKFRVEQVIINLLTNAAKYGPNKPIIVELQQNETEAILSIQDFGIGIAEDDKSRIFRRFERAISKSEVSGLGLGLYISCEIVKMHQGRISVESSLGKGSKFIVHFPLRAH